MRLGVLDVGSNTVHFLVVDAHRGARPLPAFSHKAELRLADHIGDGNRLTASGERQLRAFVVEALQMALARRRPEAGLVHHSDQGAQYVSLAFGQQARDAGIAMSMGSRGDCYDNAVAESFFATIKKELVHRQPWPSRRDLSSAVFDYIEAFYNRQRRHSTLGYLSPEEFERGRITTTNND